MKVAIVGSADTSRDLAPYGDESWEIWTLNDMYKVAPRMDRMFQIHDPDRVKQLDPEGWAWLTTQCQVPVWMHRPVPEIPTAQQYPTEVILKEFGRYFTNSVSWMIALAIYEGADEIGVFGVDMAHGTEYASQKPSCEYFLGWAKGRGILLHIPEVSDLLKCREQYGLENSAFAANLDNRFSHLNEQLMALRGQKTQAMLNEAKTEGALEILSYVRCQWNREG